MTKPVSAGRGGPRSRGPSFVGAQSAPNLGLVCITAGPEVRYRTITRTRFLSLPVPQREAKLDELYRSNVHTLFNAVDFCHANAIRLYRCTSGLFPQVDDASGKKVRSRLRDVTTGFGRYAQEHDVRVLLHPDQYVVLNSDSPAVRAQSLAIMRDHADAFDLLGLPRSAWSCMILHGGKGGRSDALVDVIKALPEAVRTRIALENDESAYGAEAILDVCRRARVPMVFDAHHHVVKEKLGSYEHDSVRYYTEAARDTWADPAWQIVHVSNGATSFADPRHSDLLTVFPSAFLTVPWVEVEAKLKEQAIDGLRRLLPRLRQSLEKGRVRPKMSGLSSGR